MSAVMEHSIDRSLKRLGREVFIRTFTLTLAAETTLLQLTTDATEALGREVKEEEVIQAFLEYAAMPDHEWVGEALMKLMGNPRGQ